MNSRQLADRCSELLEPIPIRCQASEFNEDLSSIFDPDRQILVITDKRERLEKQAMEEMDRPEDSHSMVLGPLDAGGGLQHWIKDAGGLAKEAVDGAWTGTVSRQAGANNPGNGGVQRRPFVGRPLGH